MLSVLCMAGLGNCRPEANWQCIDFDPFYTVSYGNCFSMLAPCNHFLDNAVFVVPWSNMVGERTEPCEKHRP